MMDRGKISILGMAIIIGGFLLPVGVIRVASGIQENVYLNKKDVTSNYHAKNYHLREFSTQSITNTQPVTLAMNEFQSIVSTADLVISKTTVFDYLDVGSSSNNLFQINIKNVSPSEGFIGPITIVDDFPPGNLTPTQVSANDPRLDSCSIAGNSVTCVYTPSTYIQPGQLLNPIFIRVAVDPNAIPQSSNLVNLIANDADHSNNSDMVTVPIRYTDLELYKKVNDETPRENEIITYTLTITNNGPFSTTNIVVLDKLPNGIIYNSHIQSTGSYIPATGRWNIVSLPVNSSASLLLVGRVAENPAEIMITNTAELIEMAVYDINDNNDISDVTITIESPDLKIDMNDLYNYVYPGFVFTYTLDISNVGQISATGVTITDVLGTNYVLLSDTIPGNYTKIGNKYVWANIPDFSPSQHESYKLEVEVDNPLSTAPNLSNTVEVSQDSHEFNEDDNISADLNKAVYFDILKTVSPPSARIGESLTFNITVQNRGNATAENIEVIDYLPGVFDILSASCESAGCTIGINIPARTVTANIRNLSGGSTAIIRAVARVNSSAVGSTIQSNGATVNGENRDGIPAIPSESDYVIFTVIGNMPETFFPLVIKN